MDGVCQPDTQRRNQWHRHRRGGDTARVVCNANNLWRCQKCHDHYAQVAADDQVLE